MTELINLGVNILSDSKILLSNFKKMHKSNPDFSKKYMGMEKQENSSPKQLEILFLKNKLK